MKILVAVLILLLLAASWYFYDEPLLPETRVWLESPPAVSPEDDVLQLIIPLYTLGTPSFSEVIGPNICDFIDTRCKAHVLSEREHIKKHMPADPEYWSIVEQTFGANKISNDPSRMLVTEESWGQMGNYITALKLYYIRALVEQGRITSEMAITSLNAQRRLLADAPFLTDKMIFVATTGIALTALRLSIA